MKKNVGIKNNTFIFWQNIISLHQASFLSSLSKINIVILVVEKSLDQRRIKDGWNIPDVGDCKIYNNPNFEELNSIFSLPNAIHIFSGINAYPLTRKGFKIAIKKNVKIGIMTEPFRWLGITGKLRFLKYFYYKIKYNRNISFILTIGNRGRWCYEKIGFPVNKIFDWGYFTRNINIKLNNSNNLLPSLIYIGSLNKNKGIMPLLHILKKFEEKFSTFTIIGDGTYSSIIEKCSHINPKKYIYIKNVPNTDIQLHLLRSDLCILPSILKEGWGCVINESLMCGTPVITSDYCGASVLINGIRGKVFSVKKNNLETILLNFFNEIPYTIEKRSIIQEWANANISGKSATEYFIKIIEFIFSNKNKPKVPWLI